jgi:hypothetical protein
MSARIASVVLCVLCGIGQAACGYSLAGRGSFLPAYVKTIGVPMFGNRTNVFNIETLVTQRVRAEFIGRGRYQILPQSTGVDLLLNGEVISVTLVPATINPQTNLATRYSITLVAKVELLELKENKVLWENPGILFRQEYDATSGSGNQTPQSFFQQDASALDRMSAEFARTIVSAILEAF